jgi:hypothetical protein
MPRIGGLGAAVWRFVGWPAPCRDLRGPDRPASGGADADAPGQPIDAHRSCLLAGGQPDRTAQGTLVGGRTDDRRTGIAAALAGMTTIEDVVRSIQADA